MNVPLINRLGIPCLESVGATLTAESLTLSFNPHPHPRLEYQGLIAIKIGSQFTAPETAVPVQFTTVGVANSTKPLVAAGGTPVTTDTLPSSGIILCFYDRSTDTLQLL